MPKFKSGFLLVTYFLLSQCSPKVKSTTPNNSTSTVINSSSGTEIEKVVALANAFKSSLSADQQKILQLPYSKTDAAKWSNFPDPARPVRVGISFEQLDSIQVEAAKILMAFVLDKRTLNEGYDEVEGILAADDLLETLPNKDRIFGLVQKITLLHF